MSENGGGHKGKLITRLLDRQATEAALERMLVARTDAEWDQQAQRVAQLGPEVLRVLLQKLDTPNAQVLAAIGTIATHLDRDAVTTALLDLVYKPDTADVRRMAAILILERHLGESVEDAAFMSLQDPRGVAKQSLTSILAAARENRFLLLEYLHILLEQPAEATRSVIEALGEIGGDEATPLLRLLAQDEEADIATQALDALLGLETPGTLQALESLLPTLPPPLHDRAERALRKMRFRGQEVPLLPPVPPRACRALVSPVDGRGNQVIWFLRLDRETRRYRFLSVLINDVTGLRDAFGDDAALRNRFPRRRAQGTVHAFHTGDQVLVLLETPYDYGRQLLLRGLSTSFGLGLSTPPEYRLLNDLVWGYALPAESAALSPSEGQRAEQPPRLPTLMPGQERAMFPLLGTLLDHPAMESWFVESESVYSYIERLMRWQNIDLGNPTAQRWLMNLVTEHFHPDALARYQKRLVHMSEWFMWAGDEDTARLAWVAAATLPRVPPQQHPLVVRMIEIGLAAAAENIRQGFDLRKTPEAFA